MVHGVKVPGSLPETSLTTSFFLRLRGFLVRRTDKARPYPQNWNKTSSCKARTATLQWVLQARVVKHTTKQSQAVTTTATTTTTIIMMIRMMMMTTTCCLESKHPVTEKKESKPVSASAPARTQMRQRKHAKHSAALVEKQSMAEPKLHAQRQASPLFSMRASQGRRERLTGGGASRLKEGHRTAAAKRRRTTTVEQPRSVLEERGRRASQGRLLVV